MTNTDTVVDAVWPDRPLTETQERNRQSAALIPVGRSGALPMDFAQMVDYAKFMSNARGAVGSHLMGNVGACLAIMEIAKQFDMPAYAVARQSYLVNGRVAFMGQFYHALINKYCPLQEKLKWSYEGEGGERRILISGTFKDETEPRVYTSPRIKDIKVKNSPLWVSEPDRQLVYFGVRGWQTIHWPEGMLEIQTDDEAAVNYVGAENAKDITDGAGNALRDRLLTSQRENEPIEGYREGFAHNELDAARHDAPGDAEPAADAAAAEPAADTAAPAADAPTAAPEPEKAAKKPRGKKKEPEPVNIIPPEPETSTKPAEQAEIVLPKTADEWIAYCTAWSREMTDPDAMVKRWDDERGLRNKVGVTSDDRMPVQNELFERINALKEAQG